MHMMMWHFSTLSLAIFSVFGNTSYVSEVGGFNGDGGQHPISDMWPKSYRHLCYRFSTDMWVLARTYKTSVLFSQYMIQHRTIFTIFLLILQTNQCVKRNITVYGHFS